MTTLSKTSPKAAGCGSHAQPPAALKLQNYINGAWTYGASSKEIVSENPADTRDRVAVFPGASKKDLDAAITAAANAFPAWRRTPAPERGRILARAAQIARSKKEELAQLLTREEGKILPEARGEIEKGINLIEWYAGEGMRLGGSTAPSEIPRNFLYTVREPLGPVAIVTPWNFPWAIPVWKIAPALLAGNTVVFKPASLVPAMAVEVVKVFVEAGLPPGVLNLVLGSGSEVGNALLSDPRIQAVSFTGSNSVGRGVHALAGSRGIKASCEMGGKNPLCVWEDADWDLALAGLLKGAFGSTGQRCTATSRLILHDKIAEPFLKRLVEETRKIRVGNGMDPSVGMGPAVDGAQLRTDLDYIETAQKEGAELLTGGRPLREGDLKNGYFLEPTIFGGVTPAMRIFKEEVFGPVLSVTTVKDFDEMLAAANDCAFGLTASFYGRDLGLALRFAEEAQCGMVHVNSPTIGGEAQVPFGGIKGSGFGDREMAKEGLHFFTELKTVFLDYTGKSRSSNVY